MMSPHTRKNILVAALVLLAIALCLVFPRMRMFSQIFMREFRFLWWLLLIAGVAIYFSVIRGRRNKR
jgi:asparagine N-glycosylation enzyme membrane subunit Stt3